MNQFEHFQIKLPAKFKYLNIVGACIESFMVHMKEIKDPDQMRYMLQLAVHEVCNNIVEHAYRNEDGHIWVEFFVSYVEQYVMVDLRDQGRSFEITAVADPDLDQPAEQGYGLYLVRQIMDTVEYKTEDGHNHWHMEKRF